MFMANVNLGLMMGFVQERLPEILIGESKSSALNLKITPLSFLKILAQRFYDWETRFLNQGFEPIRVAWLARAARLGDVITARVSGEDITGRFDRIDDSGHLQLQTRSGVRSIAAAEIYFRGT